MESVPNMPTQGFTLLDVRESNEWAAGHAPDALHIPLGELPSRIEEIAQLPEDRPLYVVCRTGGRSSQAAAWLNDNGFDAVNVAGGMKSWQTENRPLVCDHPDIAPDVL